MNPPKTPQKPAKFAPDARILVLVAVTFGARIDGGLYDYKVGPDQSLSAGDVVRVPLGARTLPGVVWGPGSGAVDAKKLKSVIERFQVAPMHRVMRDFIDWLAGYCLASPGSVLKMALNVPDALEPPKSERAWVLADEMPELKITPARGRVLEFMAGQAPAFSVDIAREAACSSSVITGLAKAGALEGVEVTHKPNWPAPDPDAPGPELSPAQTTAAKSLAARVGAGRSVTLLDGVPGSGKTEVYFEAVAEALRQGGQVLVLLPEIALSAQWLRRFEARFGSPPAVWHSDLGSAKRRETWRGVNDGSVRLVVGARSALFLPFHQLSLIVIDEEHDPAFKQEEGVIYHARDMAVVRSHLGEIPIVLVSATPSLESATHAQSGKYHLEHLPERHAGATLPEVELVDMRAEKLPATRWLSDTLIAQLKAAFAAGEQAMLFLNRRGYAPLTLCRTCGHRLKCPHCSAWLVEHRQGARLQCHHCGFVAPKPDKCPECEDENSFAACGPGVERLAEEV
ncbi:MAG: primosomal protein N', partial [Rhodospirillaceae bacterium]|nr:primosomal protein N' [Rhodospirillaceae bacterium]